MYMQVGGAEMHHYKSDANFLIKCVGNRSFPVQIK